MVILTLPPPASPITSMVAISAWAFCILACIAWTCFSMLLKLPRMGAKPVRRCAPAEERWSFYRPHRGRQPGGAKALAQPLHARISLERAPRQRQLLLRSALRQPRRGLAAAARLKLEPDRLAEVTRQRLGEL